MFHSLSVEDLEHFFSDLPQQQQQAHHLACSSVHALQPAPLPVHIHISSEDVEAFFLHLDSLFLRRGAPQVQREQTCFVFGELSCFAQQQQLEQQQQQQCEQESHQHHGHHYYQGHDAHAVRVPDMDQAAFLSHQQTVPQLAHEDDHGHAGSPRSRRSSDMSELFIDQDAIASDALASPQLSPSSLDGDAWPFGDMYGGQDTEAAAAFDLAPRACSAPVSSAKRKRYGSRMYTCEVCGFTCKDSGNIVRHRRRHNPERKYTCTVCGRGFNNSSNHKKHEQRCGAPKCLA